MAWFRYECPEHGMFRLSLEERAKMALCPACSKESRAIIRLGSITVVERLDNGAMARTVERLNNVEEIMEERSRKNDEETGGGPVDDDEN